MTTIYERLRALQINLPELPPPVVDGYVPSFVPFAYHVLSPPRSCARQTTVLQSSAHTGSKSISFVPYLAWPAAICVSTLSARILAEHSKETALRTGPSRAPSLLNKAV
jgi:hypothetical protein